MKYLVTSYKNNEEKENLQKNGLYCYDLRSSDVGDKIATIEKLGAIIMPVFFSFDRRQDNLHVKRIGCIMRGKIF